MNASLLVKTSTIRMNTMLQTIQKASLKVYILICFNLYQIIFQLFYVLTPIYSQHLIFFPPVFLNSSLLSNNLKFQDSFWKSRAETNFWNNAVHYQTDSSTKFEHTIWKSCLFIFAWIPYQKNKSTQKIQTIQKRKQSFRMIYKCINKENGVIF